MTNRPTGSSIVFHNVISAIDEINLIQDGHSGGQGVSHATTWESSQAERDQQVQSPEPAGSE